MRHVHAFGDDALGHLDAVGLIDALNSGRVGRTEVVEAPADAINSSSEPDSPRSRSTSSLFLTGRLDSDSAWWTMMCSTCTSTELQREWERDCVEPLPSIRRDR